MPTDSAVGPIATKSAMIIAGRRPVLGRSAARRAPRPISLPAGDRNGTAALNEDSPDARAARLLQLSEKVSRIAGSLAQLSIGAAPTVRHDRPNPNLNDRDIPLQWVSWLIGARRKRACYLASDFFGEPAWDILLDLLRAELADERISESRACLPAGVPASTARRWLNALEQQGLVLRQCGTSDGGGTFVVLAPGASKALRRYFLEVVARPDETMSQA